MIVRASRRRCVRLLAVTAACIVVLAAVTATSAAASSASPSPAAGLAAPVFRVGFSYDIDGMNPLVNYSGLSWEIFRLNYNFLTWYDDSNQPVPELATAWTTSADGKVWTYTIRSDGTTACRSRRRTSPSPTTSSAITRSTSSCRM
jgi:peptide/nickel transport system substrate-binding protein